jgi:hypothetical protein
MTCEELVFEKRLRTSALDLDFNFLVRLTTPWLYIPIKILNYRPHSESRIVGQEIRKEAKH